MPRRPIATSTERDKKKKSEFDIYFKMTSSVMNARMEMVKCKSAKSTSQCVEEWSIEECIKAVEKLGDIDGDTYNKLIDKLIPSIEWRKSRKMNNKNNEDDDIDSLTDIEEEAKSRACDRRPHVVNELNHPIREDVGCGGLGTRQCRMYWTM
ncbi:hypothetical protein CUMW_120110 [Citrus unshiu]|uniref:Uncharacterized protein n=1 Tax=Citrus unshiu TaxID=55188 RepID=A0A2H5PB37_CITUN|nr:hypothetical protein CUMW_120110 [Citrus unshiu]